MKLTTQERLEDLRKERKLTLEDLAEQIGISKSALATYENNDTKDISLFALTRLAKFYGVTTDYLLALTETKYPSDADAASLHLSEELMDLLRSERINISLLNELAVHPGFVKLLADIEIYVDGVAQKQIETMNAYVNTVREEIMKRYHPSEYESGMYLLKSMEIQEGEYFSQRVHDDIDAIMEDLRKDHAARHLSSEKAPIESMLEDTLEIISDKDNRDEKAFLAALKQLGIPRQVVTEEEKQMLIKFIRKINRIQNASPQRGKTKRK